MSDRTARGCAHQGVVTGHMARDAAYSRAFQTTMRLCGPRSERETKNRGDEQAIHGRTSNDVPHKRMKLGGVALTAGLHF